MKMKHYRAPDMRQALRQVRDAQGPDAVILSSRRIQGGVEVVAAVDYDGEVDAALATTDAYQPTESRYETVAEREPAAADYAAIAKRFADQDRHEISDLPANANEELRTLRRMLETQLATLAWNDLSRRAPIQTELLRQLTVLGIAHDLAGELVAQLPQRMELSEAQRLALAMLTRRIETAPERWMESGGAVALVGPTGVGKTTLIAKLAARWVLRHGPRDIALISTDCVRIGAQEQIHTLGRLLGVPAYAIDGAADLAGMLDHLSERRLVLIDTAGLSQRDARLPTELATLANASDRIETSLVISAAAQAGALEEALVHFALARPMTCVVTKLDEATSLGGTLSALIRSKLPVAYLSDGQQVPEDLSPARAHQLIARAVQLAKKAGAMADEDLLQRRFGAVAHGMA
ncbi:MAG TPA: flagellar biosynthesis protein FlhF [Steroidobacteraceae bacterium]|nr:flagellar biosynthesis protein FlhF [Steroidobacteraceae bacterium]